MGLPLASLGVRLPPLPTTTVGSFPKPEYLTAARARVARGEMKEEELRGLERQATEFWIREQERIGVDVLVDGEMYRGDMVAYFAEEMDGFAEGGLVRSYGNRYYRKPVVNGPVRWKGPMTVAWWRYAQGLTKLPVKGMLTGPYTIMDWSFNEHYPDRKAVCLAVAGEIRKEVAALIEAGAKIIQVDEPALSVRSDEFDVAREAMEIVTAGQKAYFVTHICYGKFEEMYPALLDLAVDNFDLEMTNSDMKLLAKVREHPFTKDISFGVLDVHSHAIETPAAVEDRIRLALKSVPQERLWIDPDCGLKTREVPEAIGKLESMLAAVRKVRSSLPPKP